MIRDITFQDMVLWEGLPALRIADHKGQQLAVFSSRNGKFVMCEIPYDRRDDVKIKESLLRQGFFDCILGKKEPYKSDIFTLVLSLTEKCNCRCKYCFLEADAEGKVMSIALLHDSIDEATKLANGRIINLSAFGGEPGTEWGLLKEMVDYSKKCSSQRFKYSITTNGLLQDKVVDFLIENKFEVSLSMDGIPEVQNYHRPIANGKDSYPYVEKNLERLAHSISHLKVRCTVTNYSVARMAETVTWLSAFGIKRIHFEPVTLGGRACNSDSTLQPPTATDFSTNLKTAIKEGAKYNMDIICFPYMNMMIAPAVFCDGSIENRLVVSPTGVLSSCVEVQTRDHELFPDLGLGQYDSDSRTFQITYDRRRVAKRGYVSADEDQRKCKNCALKFFCGGGCPTRNYRGSGNSSIVDRYRCDITRSVMPFVLEQFYKKNRQGGD